MRFGTLCFKIFLLVCLSACQSNWAPVEDKTRPRPVLSGKHTVQDGDTLYSIAWQYGRDFSDLAAINRISPPYVIYPKQTIYLSTSSIPARSRPAVRTVVASTQKSSKNIVSKSNQSTKPVSKWGWPASGNVSEKYGQNGNLGINILGEIGQPVKATAEGEIVYSGEGLKGYGKLIIIRHSGNYLSAYAHNNRILVKEGQQVKVGEKIAEMGRSDSDRVMLHFEIRKNGRPVNPLGYLSQPS